MHSNRYAPQPINASSLSRPRARSGLARHPSLSKLESGPTRRLGECLHPAVILIAPSVEDSPADAPLLGLLPDALADDLRRRHVAACAEPLPECRGSAVDLC